MECVHYELRRFNRWTQPSLVNLLFYCEVKLLLRGMQAKTHVSVCLRSKDNNKRRLVWGLLRGTLHFMLLGPEKYTFTSREIIIKMTVRREQLLFLLFKLQCRYVWFDLGDFVVIKQVWRGGRIQQIMAATGWFAYLLCGSTLSFRMDFYATHETQLRRGVRCHYGAPKYSILNKWLN